MLHIVDWASSHPVLPLVASPTGSLFLEPSSPLFPRFRGSTVTQGLARPLRPPREPAQPPPLECLSSALSLSSLFYI